MEQQFSTCSVLEFIEKIMEDDAVIKENMEGGEDENNWDGGL